MQPTTKKSLYPAVRFIPDVDEKGVVLIDERTKEYKSGLLEVSLFEASINGAATLLGSYNENVSYKKYQAIREDIDHMNVDELCKYFPELKSKEDAPAVEDDEKAKLQAQIESLTKALEAKDEKKSAPKSNKATGKTDGKSGAKKTEQKSPSTDKVDPEK